MKIAFVVNSDINNRAGYFNAVHSRIKQLPIADENKKIFTIRFYDNKILSLIRGLASKKKISIARESHFEYDGLKYEYLYLKRSLSSMVLWKLGAVFKAIRFEMNLKQMKMFEAFDLISAHWGDSCGNLACAISKNMGVPVAITYHGSDIHSIPKWRQPRIVANLKFADMSIFVSKYLKKEAEKIHPHIKKSSVVYNSVESSFLERNETGKSEIATGNEITLGFLGALIPLKGVKSLSLIVQNLELLTGKSVKLVLLGEGGLKEELEQEFQKKGISAEFVGMVKRSEVRKYILNMDVLVLPSQKEGLGLVLLEAIALGVPAVGSDVGGISEVVGKDYVVPLGEDFEARFAKKIEQVLGQPNKQAINEEFNEDFTSKLEYEIYSQMLSHRM